MNKNYAVINVELTGKKICTICKDKGYSVKELQHLLCLETPQSIYRWFGKTLPSLSNLYNLSKILSVPMEDLLVAETVAIEKKYDY